jgi:hypothetical protein
VAAVVLFRDLVGMVAVPDDAGNWGLCGQGYQGGNSGANRGGLWMAMSTICAALFLGYGGESSGC